jgi:hypothetical protein
MRFAVVLRWLHLPLVDDIVVPEFSFSLRKLRDSPCGDLVALVKVEFLNTLPVFFSPRRNGKRLVVKQAENSAKTMFWCCLKVYLLESGMQENIS